MNDTVHYFPWAILVILLVSLAVAELVVPFLQYWIIKKPMGGDKKKHFNFLDLMQKAYNWLIDLCFKHWFVVCFLALVTIVLSAVILLHLPQRLMPRAERNQFAVEIYLPTGTSLEKTVALADSLEGILHNDDRIVSIASFKGTASPRFHTVYAPQFGGANYAQFIVNTISPKATEEILAEYKPKYEEAFPDAYVRFKQLDYGAESNPIEVRLTGNDWSTLKAATDSLTRLLRNHPKLKLVRNDMNEPLLATEIHLDPVKASRLGISNADAEISMLMRYNASGMPLGTIWNGDYPIAVSLKRWDTHASEG